MPVPEIEDGLHRAIADEIEDRGLHLFLGHMERAHAIPVCGDLREIARRGVGAVAADFREALAVGDDLRVGGIDAAQDVAREPCGGAAVGEIEEGPGALAVALDEAGLDQQLQVPRDAGLGLAEDVHELADRDFRLGEQGEEPQARDSLPRPRGWRGSRRARRAASRGELDIDINICLYETRCAGKTAAHNFSSMWAIAQNAEAAALDGPRSGARRRAERVGASSG